MRAHVYASEQQAQRVIDAIDAARGPTELVRLPDGSLEERPTLTWAHPVPLTGGRWAVPVEERVRALGGREVGQGAARVRIPEHAEAVEVGDEERAEREAQGAGRARGLET